jgi:branched-chain amino acid transport system substrate-binding protein
MKKPMKKKLLIMLGLMLIVSLVAACAQTSPTEVQEQAEAEPMEEVVEEAPAEEEPVEEAPVADECPLEGGVLKIGMIQPVSGAAAATANKVISGATLAIEEINEAGGALGCEVELVIEDSQADAAVAVSAYEKLVNQDKVEAIIGAYHSHASLAVRPLLSENEVPMLTVIATSPAVTADNDGWMFRISSTNEIDAEVAVDAYWDTLGFEKWGFLPVNNDWGKSVPTGYEPVINEHGGTIELIEPLEQGAANFLPQLTKVRSSEADTVAATIDIESLATLAKQAYEAGMTDQYKWIVTSGNSPPELLDVLGDTPEAAEGYLFTAYYRLPEMEGGDTPQNIAFAEAFEARFPDLPVNYSSAQGYQGAYIMVEAINRAGVYDGSAIRDALTETDYQGVTGHLVFNEDGQAFPEVHFQQIKDGEIIALSP